MVFVHRECAKIPIAFAPTIKILTSKVVSALCGINVSTRYGSTSKKQPQNDTQRACHYTKPDFCLSLSVSPVPAFSAIKLFILYSRVFMVRNAHIVNYTYRMRVCAFR